MFFAKANPDHALHTISRAAAETAALQKDREALSCVVFSYWKGVDLACAEPLLTLAHTHITGGIVGVPFHKNQTGHLIAAVIDRRLTINGDRLFKVNFAWYALTKNTGGRP